MNTYKTSEFANKAHVTVRAVRYYDAQGLLKPSGYDESGYRSYTDADFFQLQKIMSLKYLGFSLKEIRQLMQEDAEQNLSELIDLQIRLMRKKMENMKQVESALVHAKGLIEDKGSLEWNEVIHLIYLMEMENQLLEQYKNAENVGIRIRLHAECAVNPQGWFPWIAETARLWEASRILEVGCGNGELWQQAGVEPGPGREIVLSDISAGMVQDAKKRLSRKGFRFLCFDCADIPFEDGSFDRVVANHVLFYSKNIPRALREIARVLSPDGTFCASTYGSRHMQEISALVRRFDSRINLSEIDLYQIFGLENGEALLREHFEEVVWQQYEDSLLVADADLLCDYIFSCHGNQAEILCSRKKEFRQYIAEEVRRSKGLRITKEAGVFLCRRPVRKTG